MVFLPRCDVGPGGARCCGAAAEVVVFHVHEESAFGADPLSSVTVCASINGVKVSFPGYFDDFVGVQHRAVAHLVLAAVVGAADASLGVVVVVFHLSVGAAVVVTAGCPMEGGVVVLSGLSYSRQGW